MHEALVLDSNQTADDVAGELAAALRVNTALDLSNLLGNLATDAGNTERSQTWAWATCLLYE